jgi:nucleoid-associated protein YgaU
MAVSGAAKKASRKTARGRDGALTTEGEAGDSSMYRVRYNPARRDCLWRIAARHFKNPRLWKRIYEANREKIRNPHLIYPGMMLKLPSVEKPKDVKEKHEMKAIKKDDESSPSEKKEDAGKKPIKDESGS